MTDAQVEEQARQHLRSQGMLSAPEIEELLRLMQDAGTPDAKARAREVVALCCAVGKPRLATSFVAAGLTLAQAQQRLRNEVASPFVRAPAPHAPIKGNPAFDAMAKALFGKRAKQ